MPITFHRLPCLTGAALLAGSLLLSPGQAHHSDAMFDHSKEISVAGTVKDFQWTSPHVWLQVVDGAGKETGFEAVSPNTMVRDGWRYNSLKPGDQVTVVGNPRRDGQSGGFLIQVTKADGSILGGRRKPPAAAAATP